MKHAARFLGTTLLGCVWLVAAALPLAAQGGDSQLPDATVQQVLEHRLAERDLTSEVHVAVHDGTVTLTGTVDTLAEKNQAEKLAYGVDDVTRVDDQLQLRSTSLSDEAVAKAVSRKIRNDVNFTIFDWVQGDVKDGVVTLTGYATQPWKKDQYANGVERVPGVRAVENRIEVLPVSINDDQLRWNLARRIYGDLAFDQYAYGAHPPIHIIVDNGHITLEGAVATEVQRHLAESIARNEVTSFGVQNNLKVATG